jgi:hypothetical protein
VTQLQPYLSIRSLAWIGVAVDAPRATWRLREERRGCWQTPQAYTGRMDRITFLKGLLDLSPCKPARPESHYAPGGLVRGNVLVRCAVDACRLAL